MARCHLCRFGGYCFFAGIVIIFIAKIFLMEPLDYSILPERPVTYAGFWERFGAAFIDGLLIGVASSILNWTVFKDNVFGSLLVFVAQWLYYALMESGPNQATLGKKALGLKVTDL